MGGSEAAPLQRRPGAQQREGARTGPQRPCGAGTGAAHFSVTFTRALPGAAALQPQPKGSDAPLPVAQGRTGRAKRKCRCQAGPASRALAPFPGRLRGEEIKDWEGGTSLHSSLRSLRKVPSLPCLAFLTKTTGFRVAVVNESD